MGNVLKSTGCTTKQLVFDGNFHVDVAGVVNDETEEKAATASVEHVLIYDMDRLFETCWIWPKESIYLIKNFNFHSKIS